MILVLLLIFLLSFISPFLERMRHYGLLIILGSMVLVLAYFLSLTGSVLADDALYFEYSWIQELSVSFSFFVDGLSLFFALLIIFFGILILLYSSSYLKHEKHLGRFYAYLIFFMGSMLGLVLASNLVSIFIFWELTSFSSYLLIGFHNKEEKSRQAARQALLVTGLGGLALLAGFVLMGIAGDTYEVPELLANKNLILDHPYLQAIVILILLGVFTKSAQFPFHFWLPNAMEAPTPVSAYLHSSTMVKAGIYLIFRFNPIFTDAELWLFLMTVVGAITMLLGAVEAFRADDLKRLLAYTTISALGIFIMMVGMGTEASIKAAFIYLIAHALYKGALFLIAGVLDHTCGTRKLSALSRIKKKMPYTAIAMVLACASMAGIIPFLGFTGKELLYKSAYLSPLFHYIPLGLLVVSNVLFVAIALKILLATFFNKPKGNAIKAVEEAPLLIVLPSLVLGILGMFFGIFSGISLKPISLSAVGDILNTSVDLDLGLWHGFNFILLLSILTLFLGGILYVTGDLLVNMLKKIKAPLERIPEIIFDRSIDWLQRLARIQTGLIQNGYLRNYISVYISVFILTVLFYMYNAGISLIDTVQVDWQELLDFKLIVLVLVVVTLLFIFLSQSQLVVVAAIGIIGYSIALSYTMFSAPDVAITQFLAESLSLILLILIAPKLPGLLDRGIKMKRKYILVSVAFGVLMTVITLMGMHLETASQLKDYLLENSLPEGKGANVVNVILVDYRALDTLGEISVLVITMIGIISLMRTRTTNP